MDNVAFIHGRNSNIPAAKDADWVGKVIAVSKPTLPQGRRINISESVICAGNAARTPFLPDIVTELFR